MICGPCCHKSRSLALQMSAALSFAGHFRSDWKSVQNGDGVGGQVLAGGTKWGRKKCLVVVGRSWGNRRRHDATTQTVPPRGPPRRLLGIIPPSRDRGGRTESLGGPSELPGLVPPAMRASHCIVRRGGLHKVSQSPPPETPRNHPPSHGSLPLHCSGGPHKVSRGTRVSARPGAGGDLQ